VRHGLAHEEIDLRLTGSHQLDDMIPWRILHILPINRQDLIARLQFSDTWTTLCHKSHYYGTLTTGHKSKSQTGIPLKLDMSWFWRMLIPAYAFGRLVGGRFIEVASWD